MAADVLIANADTYIKGIAPTSNFDHSTGDSNARLLVRSLEDSEDRAQYAYIRFDLTSYPALQSGASLTLTTTDSSASWTSTQMEVYGLADSAGVTAQNWVETDLTYDTTGAEFVAPFPVSSNPLVASELVSLGTMPAGAGGDTATLSNAALDAFLATRAGETVTFLVTNKYDTNRLLIINSREASSGFPTLTVTADPAPQTYYVATDGSDTNPGTLALPFASLQKANDTVVPGDTVYIRGGTYTMANSDIERYDSNIFARVIYFDQSGLPGRRINYWAYPGEQPKFDFSNVTPADYRVYAFSVSGSWLHFRGIEVVGVQVTITGHTQSISFENNGNNNIYEQLSMHDSQAIGFYSVRGSDNLVLNCDAYNNWDYTSQGGTGGNVDGFGFHPRAGDTGNMIDGCRAWFNSDDGYDLINAKASVVIANSWAFNNGYSTSFASLGDGNGFKAGGYGSTAVAKLPNPIPRHKVYSCLAVNNKAYGMYANHHIGGGDWFYNTAYRNKHNFNMLCRLSDNVTDVDGYGHDLGDNLSYKSRLSIEISNIDNSQCTRTNNSFDLSAAAIDSDFETLDESQLTLARKQNGDLPTITLMRPTASSAFDGMGFIHDTVIEAEADTYLRGDLSKADNNYDYPSGDSNMRLLVRSLGSPTRAQYGYIRFDLSTFSRFDLGASLSLTSIGGHSWSSGQLKIYGLQDSTGLTAQNWAESSLTYNTTGSEFSKPVVEDVDPFVTTGLVFLGDMPAAAVGDTVTLPDSAALQTFLNDRAGSTATFVVANAFDGNCLVILASRDAAVGTPKLTVKGVQ